MARHPSASTGRAALFWLIAAVTAGIFWMKTRTRWKEVSVHQHAGVPDRTIIEIRPIILTPLTEADRSM